MDVNNGNQESRETDLKIQAAERALARHRRRIRAQVAAYLTVAVLLIALGGLLYVGGIRFARVVSERRAAAKLAKEAEAMEAVDPEQEEASLFEAAPEEAETETILTPEPVLEEVQDTARTQEELLDEFIDSLIADMPLKDKVAGLFLVTPEQLTGVDAAIKAGDGTEDALQEKAVGGVVYTRKNIKSEEQIAEMLQTTSNMSKYPLFLATTEAGGDLGELTGGLSLEELSSPAQLAEAGDTGAAFETGEAIAKRLIHHGFQVDLGLNINLTSDAMSEEERKSSFGSDPAVASAVMSEMIRGLETNGIHTIVKLFPATASDEAGIPSAGITSQDLDEGDGKMFAAAMEAGTRMVMVGNLAVPEIVGDNTPCSMSSAVIMDELRGKLAFDGVVVTDAMDSRVITDYYTADQAAVAAVKAGADIIYRPEDLDEALDGVVDAVNSGVIAESRIDESLKRIYRIKYEDRTFG